VFKRRLPPEPNQWRPLNWSRPIVRVIPVLAPPTQSDGSGVAAAQSTVSTRRRQDTHPSPDAALSADDRSYQAAEKSRPVNASHPLKGLALYGQHEVEGPAIEGAVILELPSIEATKAFYHSAAYRDAARHRFLGADYRAFIVEGIQPTK
jgi:uncharacterized protein (DUF1330 family)